MEIGLQIQWELKRNLQKLFFQPWIDANPNFCSKNVIARGSSLPSSSFAIWGKGCLFSLWWTHITRSQIAWLVLIMKATVELASPEVLLCCLRRKAKPGRQAFLDADSAACKCISGRQSCASESCTHLPEADSLVVDILLVLGERTLDLHELSVPTAGHLIVARPLEKQLKKEHKLVTPGFCLSKN